MWLKTNSWECQSLHLVSNHLSFPELPQYPTVGLQTQSVDGYSQTDSHSIPHPEYVLHTLVKWDQKSKNQQQ